jgi:hypothetical protein
MEDTTSAVPINSMTDEEIRQELTENGVTLHHKTGSKKLASTLADVRTKEYKEDPKDSELQVTGNVKHRSLPGSTPESRAAKERHIANINTMTAEKAAMKLVRVVVTPNDPLMVNYPGLIFTVGMSGINNGRMIKKFVPFSNEDGWHIPTIILRQVESAEMQKFKTVTRPNGEKVLEPYLTKKFNVQILPDLTNAEIKRLADQQTTAGFNVGVN